MLEEVVGTEVLSDGRIRDSVVGDGLPAYGLMMGPCDLPLEAQDSGMYQFINAIGSSRTVLALNFEGRAN